MLLQVETTALFQVLCTFFDYFTVSAQNSSGLSGCLRPYKICQRVVLPKVLMNVYSIGLEIHASLPI